MQQSLGPVAIVPTYNKFANLQWIKRNNLTGELKHSFSAQQHQKRDHYKKLEMLSARVHKILKATKEKCLMKKKYERPFMLKVNIGI